MSAVVQRTRTEQTIRVVVIVVALLITLLPLVSLLLATFKPPREFFSGSLLPQDWSVGNYGRAFDNSRLWSSLVHSVLVGVITTVASTVFGTLAAFGLARLRYRWVIVLTYAILAVRFYPKIAGILPYYLMMRHFDLVDTVAAVAVAHISITLPMVMLIMSTFLDEVPPDLEESAALDGCSIWQSFSHVLLPLVRPGIATAAILTAMFSWNEFLYAATVTSTHAGTLPVLIAGFTSDKGTDLGQVAVVATIVVAPIALFILGTQRHLVRGLTLGAVKQ